MLKKNEDSLRVMTPFSYTEHFKNAEIKILIIHVPYCLCVTYVVAEFNSNIVSPYAIQFCLVRQLTAQFLHQSFQQLNNFSLFFRPTREFFIWRRHIAGEGQQILTYARHSWPLRSEGSFASHTYCDTGHPFIMVNSEDS